MLGVSIESHNGIISSQNSAQSSSRFSTWLSRIARNVNKFAIPLILFYAIENIPTAEATGILYIGCTTICSLLCSIFSAGVAIPQCIVACGAACGPTVPISIIL